MRRSIELLAHMSVTDEISSESIISTGMRVVVLDTCRDVNRCFNVLIKLRTNDVQYMQQNGVNFYLRFLQHQLGVYKDCTGIGQIK